MLLIIILIILLIIILFFSSKTLSPIPYFPSQPVDMPLIAKALNLKNNQTVFDLGAGDGIVIFKAATEALKQNLNTQFIAVEINPILILILYIRRLLHPNKKNIKIAHDDIFKMNFSKSTMEQLNNVTIYLYISPWFLEKVIENCKLKIKNFDVVSYMYPLNHKTTFAKASVLKGKNKIFTYNL